MADNVFSFTRARKQPNSPLPSNAREDRVKTPSSPEQLSFQFTDTHEIFIAHTPLFNKPNLFIDFLIGAQPQHVLDMRVAPRLDFIDESRQRAFDILKRENVNYTDMLGRAGINSYQENSESLQALWLKVVQFLENISTAGHPIVALFDNWDFVARFSAIFTPLAGLHIVDKEYVKNLAEQHNQLQM
ncbi:hypothetical protein [Xylophilus sp. GOD-11R]|uniref:hypothetical protein n=1 Tax=Xylophilus sp. GOD-11R TaxID=3089814 RepID=UPI00298BF45B|nr:hypothetical protein [Xylophilus sp. GOD-11R]WPB57386.1 hypothetical protein R9X41_01665 [Xylophilus sp. GOD-11R]